MREAMTRDNLTPATEEEETVREGRAEVEVDSPRLTSWHCAELVLNDWQ